MALSSSTATHQHWCRTTHVKVGIPLWRVTHLCLFIYTSFTPHLHFSYHSLFTLTFTSSSPYLNLHFLRIFNLRTLHSAHFFFALFISLKILYLSPCIKCTLSLMAPKLRTQLTAWYRIISITLLLLSFAPTLTVGHLCYGPHGNILPGFSICDPTNYAGVCCRINDVCMTAGLCLDSQGQFYRGGCADGSFLSSDCPKICIEGELEANFSIACMCELTITRFNDVLLDWMPRWTGDRRPVLL